LPKFCVTYIWLLTTVTPTPMCVKSPRMLARCPAEFMSDWCSTPTVALVPDPHATFSAARVQPDGIWDV
jgi:hypothetical protein